MADLFVLESQNARRWANAKLTRTAEFQAPAKKALANRNRYITICRRAGMPDEAWYFVAVAHSRESSQDFTKNLGQGDPLDKKSVHVPAGRGPFRGPTAFEDGAVDALVNCAPFAAKLKDWSIPGMLTNLERYNGLKYANAGVPSPYIWSGTDQYKSGKVLVDHGPIMYIYPSGKNKGKPVVDLQLGCAGLILTIQQLEANSIQSTPSSIDPPKPVPPAGAIVYDTLWLQQSLNKLGAAPKLLEDGIYGSGTRTAVKAFQLSHKLKADGIAGTKETIPAIKKALTVAQAKS